MNWPQAVDNHVIRDSFEEDNSIFATRNEQDDVISSTTLNDEPISTAVSLPEWKLINLPTIASTISDLCFQHQYRPNLVAYLCDNVDTLFQLLRICTDLEDNSSLLCIYKIIRIALQLRWKPLTDLLLETDERQIDIMNILEKYIEQEDNSQELASRAVFKNVAKLSDPDLLALIHRTFRLQYIQAALSTASFGLEDTHFGSTEEKLLECKMKVVTKVMNAHKLLIELCDQIKSGSADLQKQADLLNFFKELCEMLKCSSAEHTSMVLETLCICGLLSVVQHILGSEEADSALRQSSLDLFSLFVENGVDVVRRYCLEESGKPYADIQQADEDEGLVELLINELYATYDSGSSKAIQIMNSLKLLLGCGSPTMITPPASEDFVQLFFDKHFPLLLAPILANTVSLNEIKDDKKTADMEYLLIDFACSLLEVYDKKTITYLVGKNILSRTMMLLSTRHQFLKLASLRLLRRAIGLNDNLCDAYIVRAQLLEQVVNALLENNRPNLFESAVFDLFNYILREDRALLIDHFTESLYDRVCHIQCANIFENLKERCETLRQLAESSIKNQIFSTALGIVEGQDEEERRYFETEDPEVVETITDEALKDTFLPPVRTQIEEPEVDLCSAAPKLKSPMIKFNIEKKSPAEPKHPLVSYAVESDEENDDDDIRESL